MAQPGRPGCKDDLLDRRQRDHGGRWQRRLDLHQGDPGLSTNIGDQGVLFDVPGSLPVFIKANPVNVGDKVVLVDVPGQLPVALKAAPTVGTAWVTGASLNVPREAGAGCGTATAALSFGGATNPGNTTWTTEKYDGSSWTTVANLNAARYGPAGCGIQSSAFAIGGMTSYSGGSYLESCEIYNSTSWTTQTNSLNTAQNGAACCGNTSSALIFGGYNSGWLGTTELWNDLSWVTQSGSLNIPRTWLAGCGTSGSCTLVWGEWEYWG